MDLATRKMVYYGLVGLLMAGSTIALFQASPVQILPRDGTLSIYLADIQPDIQGLVGLQPVKVPSDELKIPVSPAVHIKAQMSSSIVISGTAHIVFEGNGDIMLTPVLHVEKTTGPQ